MPKEGYTTITLKTEAYDIWHVWFEERKFNLSSLGITSLSGLVTSVLFSVMKTDSIQLSRILDTEIDKK